MEWQQFELHSARQQLIKTVGHLLDTQHHLTKTLDHIKYIGKFSDACLIVEENIEALRQGVADTIRAAGVAAEEIQALQADPHEQAPPITATCGIKLTPFQRALSREGVNFGLPPHEPTKIERRLPKILPFRLCTRQYKNRHRTNDNIPL